MSIQRTADPQKLSECLNSGDYQLRLFGSWGLFDVFSELSLHGREQRTVAVLALQGRRPRSFIAGMLWPDCTESRASGSLRAALWRIEHAAPGLIHYDGRTIGLSARVRLDMDQINKAVALVATWSRQPDKAAHADSGELATYLELLLRGDLLPGWYDDWVLYERARLQQARLRALESLAELLIIRGDTAMALSAATAASAIEPLRESAERALIRVHLADGNHNEALIEYKRFRSRLIRELGVKPSSILDSLVRPLLVREFPSVPLAGRRAG